MLGNYPKWPWCCIIKYTSSDPYVKRFHITNCLGHSTQKYVWVFPTCFWLLFSKGLHSPRTYFWCLHEIFVKGYSKWVNKVIFLNDVSFFLFLLINRCLKIKMVMVEDPSSIFFLPNWRWKIVYLKIKILYWIT